MSNNQNQNQNQNQQMFPPDFYKHKIGWHDGTIRPPEDCTDIEELRDVLADLRPGKRVVVCTKTRLFQYPWIVESDYMNDDGERLIVMRGPRGSLHRIRYEPHGVARPSVDYKDPRDGWIPSSGRKDGELWTAIVVGGQTPPSAR